MGGLSCLPGNEEQYSASFRDRRGTLAIEKMDPGHPLREDLEEILTAARRSSDFTRQLLAFARKETIIPEVLDLNATVESLLKVLRRLIGEDIHLVWLPGANLWPVRMDPSQIDQTLANLCVNARDAIADVGKITIETGTVTFDKDYCADHAGFVPGDFVMLAVSDDGCGMEPLVESVLTKEEQDRLTPDKVLELLEEGNRRFVSGTLTSRDHSKQVREATKGQYPKAIILSCVDSRVPVEDVFDRGIGDVFVARVAGNFSNTDILGSMEFACKVSGSKLVLVLGHEHCGAVKGAIDGVELGNITPMLENIKPAVEHFTRYEGEKTSRNEAFVNMVAEQNVRMTIEDIRKNSPVLKEMEDKGDIRIVGGMYDMDTGKVIFLF